MPNKLIIVLSGKKQAGKNTACNFILAKFYNRRLPYSPWAIDMQNGDLLYEGKKFLTTDFTSDAKIYSFADPLKRFCIDVLGAPEEACYGTDEQKNRPIEHLRWDNMPDILRPRLPHSGNGSAGEDLEAGRLPIVCHKSGPITGRELMQLFGTNIIRRWFHQDAWARGTYSSIRREGFELALVCDARFPNEVSMGSTVGAKTIRLARNVYNDTHDSETALDGVGPEFYSLYIDNSKMSIEEQFAIVDKTVDGWFAEAGI